MSLALIVDDSKTAQARLKSLLKRYELDVDCASSAEEALSYLSYKQPTVIFLDHQMEGMDGLEALRIIKANPATATIPVVMYTSQQGDVYLGQARALGALDIINKQVVKAASIERLLASLKVKKRNAVSPADAKKAADSVGVEAQSVGNKSDLQEPSSKADNIAQGSSTELNEVRSQVARLFELHISDVRQQIAEQSRFVLKNILAELKRKNTNTTKSNPEPAQNTEIPDPVSEEDTLGRYHSRLPSIIGFLMVAGLLVFLIFEVRRDRAIVKSVADDLSGQHAVSQKRLFELRHEFSELNKASRSTESNGVDPAKFETVAWALNSYLGFEYGEEPLSERQISTLKDLILRLDFIGFKGELLINLQFGDFCIVADQQGVWQLAPPAMLANECQFLSELDQDYSSNVFLNEAYIELEQSAAPVIAGDLSLSLVSSGIVSAGEFRGLTAGDWNAHASMNNKITVTLIADID